MATRTVLAVDLGAESGRVMAIHFDGQRLSAEEIHRFPNTPVEVQGMLHWDVLRLWGDIQAGIRKAAAPASIGVDTWGVDFALLDRADHLMGNPVHYRDHRTDGVPEYVFGKVPRAVIFEKTGIQFMQLNTLYQLAAMARAQDPALESAATWLAMPDLLYFWLTGVKENEFSIATTTQFYNPRTGTWAYDILERLGIPARLFGSVTAPGVILGHYGQIPVVLAPHHDTASAVVGVPAATGDYAYLSSGTWSLFGLELPKPIINETALAFNITNEGGYGGMFRVLKNIVGMWLIQEARRTWAAGGHEYSYADLMDLAREAKPFVSLIDPDAPPFLPPGDMEARIREYCVHSGQPAPESVGAVVRCVLESLALKYRYVIERLAALSGRPLKTIHIVGGGSQNTVLCQMAADATGRTVLAGPVEATALGNAVVQLIALGDLKSMAEGRALIRESFPLTTYQPQNTATWEAVAARFTALVESTQG